VATSGIEEQDYGNYPEWLDRLGSAGVNVVLVESTFKRDISLNVAAFQKIGESLDCPSLSLIHTHAAIPSLIALLLRSKAKRAIPILQTMHGWGIRKNPNQEATDITLMNQLDLVITPSEASKRMLVRFGLTPELVAVVPNGIAPISPGTDQRTNLLRQWRSRGLKVLACIGSVGPRKNQRLLLQAMANSQAPRNLACAVIGEGEEVPALKALTREHRIADRVHFFGYQSEGAQFLSNADWLVLPSNDEGLPISLLEAYSASVPVLGSNIPEIAEILVPEETGLLFQAADLDSLVHSLGRIAEMNESERMRMGAAAKALWQECYTLEEMLGRYARIYRELVQKQ
jgi:glycosyltransferase involved in cell wall biosynthesis